MELPRTYLFQAIEAERIALIIDRRILLIGSPKFLGEDEDFFRRGDLYFPIFRGETFKSLDDLFLSDKRREIESWFIEEKLCIGNVPGSVEILDYFGENKLLSLLVESVLPKLRECTAGYKSRLKLVPEKLSMPDAENLRESFSKADSTVSLEDLDVFVINDLSLAHRRMINENLFVMGDIAYYLNDILPGEKFPHDIQVRFRSRDFGLRRDSTSSFVSDLERSDRKAIEENLSEKVVRYNPKELMKKLRYQRFKILSRLEEERFEDCGLFFKREYSSSYLVGITVPAFALRVPKMGHYIEIGQSQIMTPVRSYLDSRRFEFTAGGIYEAKVSCPTMHPLIQRGSDRICLGENIYAHTHTGNVPEDIAGALFLVKGVFERGYDFFDGHPFHRLGDLNYFSGQRISGLTVKRKGLVVTNEDV